MANLVSIKSISDHFSGLVDQNIRSLTNSISSQEAKRLTMNLIVKANGALEASDRPWAMVDQNRFLVDLLKCVTLGLDAANNECYAIPYNNTKTGKLELQCNPSAWGLKKIITKYALGKPVKDIRAFAVRANDHFTVKYTALDDLWTYEADLFGNSDVIGYVTVVVRADGTSNVMVHSLEDIAKRRAASKSPNSPAWTKWGTEMALAKAVRRHCSKIDYALPDDKQAVFQAMEDEGQNAVIEQQIFANSDVMRIDADPMLEDLEEEQARPVKHEPEVILTKGTVKSIKGKQSNKSREDLELEEYERQAELDLHQQMDMGF